jgi:hypothetical protein
VELISKEYRIKLIELSDLRRKIIEISKELNDKNITHQKFIDLNDWQENLKKEYEKAQLIADGISIAREIVMGYVFNNKRSGL